jgi:mycofactocin system transcriptional regulator
VEPSSGPSLRAGRRPATTRAQISHVGLELFARQGFDATGVEEVAAAAGISRRTLFRYFASKSDVPWGDFDTELDRMRGFLAALPPSTPLAEGLCLALVDFNTFPPQEAPWHRQRMALLFGVPALQAHSTLKYAGWRAVVAEHVAERTGGAPGDHGPRTVAWLLLGVALAAYEQWLADDDADLLQLLADGGTLISAGITQARWVGSPLDEHP